MRTSRTEIRAGDVFGRPQDVVILPGDVRHEGEAVRRVRQYRVRSRSGVLPVERRPAHRAVASERMHGRVSALMVGRQEDICRRCRWRDRSANARSRCAPAMSRHRWPGRCDSSRCPVYLDSRRTGRAGPGSPRRPTARRRPASRHYELAGAASIPKLTILSSSCRPTYSTSAMSFLQARSQDRAGTLHEETSGISNAVDVAQ